MRKISRVALCSGVAIGALVLAAPMASAQTSVLQNVQNSAAVSNPASGTNTIDLGGGGLGVGASVSTSAGGAVASTSVTAINTPFVNPAGGFGTVIQGAGNIPNGTVTNSGAIINASGDAALGSSLGIGARGAASTFSIIAMGGIPFFPVANIGDIAQGFSPTIVGSLAVFNGTPVSNTGEITGPAGGPAINLSGTGSSASVSATGALSAVSLTALEAAPLVPGIGPGFTGTAFGQIWQVPSNSTTGPTGVENTLSAGGISLGAISGDGASVAATATGAAAVASFSYVNVTNWQSTTFTGIFQNPTNSAQVQNTGTAGISVGDISGAGASVRLGAAGASAGISFSSIGSTWIGIAPGVDLTAFAQIVVNNGPVGNTGNITSSGTSGLTGAGSSAVISAVGGSASFSVSSLGDVLNGQVNSSVLGFGVGVQQTVSNAAVVTNSGLLTLGTGSLANGATASVSASGAQAAVSVSAINTTTFTSPFFGGSMQTVTNQNLVGPSPTVTNSYSAITTGALAGHGSSASATASGATAAIGASYINTTAWTAMGVLGVNQTATSTGFVSNSGVIDPGTGLAAPISVGSISGTGASVRASATGAAASVALTSIQSGPPSTFPITTGLFTGSILQTVTSSGVVFNNANIISTGTLSGIGSSAVISATGAAASVSVASINDTPAIPFVAQLGPINQTVTNNAGSVANIGSITLAGGNLGAGAAASISAVGASASVSFLAVR